jgi:putative transposase
VPDRIMKLETILDKQDSRFGATEVQAMSAVASPVTGEPYGRAAVRRVWGVARSGVYRHQASPSPTPPRRRGPTGALSDEAPTAAIRAVLAGSPFHGEGHREVWAR